MKKSLIFGGLLLMAGAMSFTACNNEDNSVAFDEVVVPYVPGIPSDDIATPNPEIDPGALNAVLPNFNYTVDMENGWAVIRLDLTGVEDPLTHDWVKLYGPGNTKQNTWLSIDGRPKGFSIYNTIDDVDNTQLSAVDLVFLVDNSGSMGQEADAIARDIIEWAQSLSRTLDMQFGCIGYDEGYISGALDMTDVETLSAWLNKSWGTSRTHGFQSAYGTDLQTIANNYRTNNWHECGVAALRMADENFTFRKGANRIYVDFTDEPNQPNGKVEFTVEYVNNPENWPSTKGTVHTVYSSRSTTYTEQMLYTEYPWRLSEYTGGTTLFTDPSFSGVTLNDLPVTGAMLNSYIIRFTNVEEIFDGLAHDVRITVKSESPNGEILADKQFNMIFVKE